MSSSRYWPPLSGDEAASAAATSGELELQSDTDENPECSHCGWVEDECECSWCAICDEKMPDCTCPTVYVVYTTTVVVEVDFEGDITAATVSSDLGDDPVRVDFEDGSRVPEGPLRRRALESCREQEWPNWDIQ